MDFNEFTDLYCIGLIGGLIFVLIILGSLFLEGV